MRADLATDLALGLDAAAFMRSLGMEPDPWQAGLLRSEAQRALLLCTRQAGKSTTTAVLALHEAIYHAPALVLLLSPSLRQSSELFRKVAGFYGQVGDAVPAEQESTLRLELENGSRIIALPGKEGTIRGFSGVSLLVIDEASRVPDELYHAVRPMLAVSGGRLVALTTPWGKRGFFHREWTEGEGWHKVRVPATECPRISAAFLAEEQRSMGEWWFRQEYGCAFVTTTNQIFAYEQVAAMVDSSIAPLWTDERQGSDNTSATILPLFAEGR